MGGKSDNFIFGLPPGLRKSFLLGKGYVLLKDIYEEIDFFGFIVGFTGKDFVLFGPSNLVCGRGNVSEF